MGTVADEGSIENRMTFWCVFRLSLSPLALLLDLDGNFFYSQGNWPFSLFVSRYRFSPVSDHRIDICTAPDGPGKAISINARHSFGERPFNSHQSLVTRPQRTSGLLYAYCGERQVFLGWVYLHAVDHSHQSTQRLANSVPQRPADIKSRYFTL